MVISPSPEKTVELASDYKLPIAVTLLSLPLFWWQSWSGALVAVFGLFLIIQARIIKLKFTPTALEVYRSDQLLRNFPYQDWLYWQIFWTKVPILFYFREVKSIHFLPVLFDPQTLKTCLETYCPFQLKQD